MWKKYVVSIRGKNEPGVKVEPKSPEVKKDAVVQKDPVDKKDTVVVAFVAMTTTSPQALVNQKYPIIADQLKTMGKKVNFISTRSLDNVYLN